ncbi:MAG: putative ester cyclase [Saprospiraceae bacterium]
MKKSLKHKKMVMRFIQEMNEARNASADSHPIFEKYFSKDVVLEITKPFEKIEGISNYLNDFWNPMIESFPDLEDQPYILIGGEYEGRDYVSLTGNFVGTFKKSWLDIPPTNQPAWLRYSATFMIKNERIVKAWYFFDILDVMRQAGYHFFPNRGIEHVPPAPMTGDGIVTYETDSTEGKKTIDLTNAMLNGLGSYDGKDLESMGQTRFWDVKNMMWYGPSGIGTTRGLKGFEDNHQVPFITAFPDRGITEKIGKEYFTQIGDGNYSCDFGFPAMYGTHLNDDWLGIKATGKIITLRVVDYWRREDDQLKENWVFIDMIDVLEQLGIDVFEMMKREIVGN